MSKSPSRSEIETALSSSNTKHKSKKKRQTAKSDFEFGEPPRRQQVIGGDLTGVNQRKKLGVFSRHGEWNIVGWLGAIVVALIVVAFFWPEQQNATTEIEVKPDQTKVVAVDEQTIEEAATGSSSFARDTDKERVEIFRQQDALDQRVLALLKSAAEHIKKRQFTQPPQDNAVVIFRQVLAIEPNNADAIDGLAKIRQHFLVRGLSMLDAGKPAQANDYLQRLSVVDRDSEEYQELTTAIDENATNQKISQLLAKANSAFRNKNLILPARTSALAYYQQALALRPNDAKAQSGIEKIADTFIAQANASVLSGDFDAAAAQLATVSVIDPEHKSIALIEAMIARAKPLAEAARNEEATKSSESTQTAKLTRDTEASSNVEPSSANPTTSGQNVADNSRETSAKTPSKQADEQAQFDQQYLQQGLNAYYSGDYDKAAALLQPLADKGIARAQMRLAYMHFLGRGFTKSREKADQIVRSTLPVIRKFANEGRGWAQSDLGSLYEDGLVLPRDYGEAVYWYRTAAEKGYPGAQTNLGLMYARGRGVASSRKTAIEWFQRAAKQGDNVAKRNLNALGVKQ